MRFLAASSPVSRQHAMSVSLLGARGVLVSLPLLADAAIGRRFDIPLNVLVEQEALLTEAVRGIRHRTDVVRVGQL